MHPDTPLACAMYSSAGWNQKPKISQDTGKWISGLRRSLHSLVFSIWNPYGMDGVQPYSMDSIWTIFWLATQPLFHSIPTMESIWNLYGMDHSMDIPCASPCGFHGISNEFTL